MEFIEREETKFWTLEGRFIEREETKFKTGNLLKWKETIFRNWKGGRGIECLHSQVLNQPFDGRVFDNRW